MNYEALGRRIRQQRKLMGMTQEELAEAMGITTSYIGHMERGIKHCTLDKLISLCIALKVSPDMLLQDSLPSSLVLREETLSPINRSILNDIAGILREYEQH